MVLFFINIARFIFANQTAKEMVKININTQEGHPITRALKQVARQVEEYKSPQTMMVTDPEWHANYYFRRFKFRTKQCDIIMSYP